MAKTPSNQRHALPHSLLYDPETGRAAAYTSNHQPITELASKKLVDYALAHVGSQAPFDREMHVQGAPRWRPLPAWAGDDVLDRLVLLWISHPQSDDDDGWQDVPKR